MVNKNIKKILSFCFLVLFFFWGHSVSALTLIDTESVNVSARVGDEPESTGGPEHSGGIGFPKTAVRFSGEAYPNAIVTTLREGKEISSIRADGKGHFDATIEEQYNSNVLYTLYAKDISGNKSLLINYPIVVRVGYLTYLSGIRFAPTIVTDKVEVKEGDYFTVSGYALPEKVIEVVIDGKDKKVFTLLSKANGSYKIILPVAGMPKGEYVVHTKYQSDTRISKLVKFSIGDTNIYTTESVESIPGDCNVDRIINLVDFSVLAFWYGKPNPPPCVDTNRDKIINLVDFSILAFYWTG